MAKKNYDELAEQIVKLVGGKENINGLRHCITRVRFRLKDESIAKDEEIKNLNGVVSLVKSGGEYMVVIGNEVENVYDAICKYLGIADGQVESSDQEEKKTRKHCHAYIKYSSCYNLSSLKYDLCWWCYERFINNLLYDRNPCFR